MGIEIFYERSEQPQVRYVSFVGESRHFDLAIVLTEQYYGKKLVLDLQGNRFAIIGEDDLEEPGYLEEAFQLIEEEAEELKEYLHTVI